MDHLALVSCFRREAQAVASLVDGLAPAAAVPTRPGSTVRDVVLGLGALHRAAVDAVALAPSPAAGAPAPAAPGEPEWLLAAVEAAAAALAARSGTDPAWLSFPARPVVASWSRRLCHETWTRRLDLTVAAGAGAGTGGDVDAAVDPALAADALDEHLTVVVPHDLARGRSRPPAGRLAISCPVPARAWLVSVGACYEVQRIVRVPDGATVDATLAGPAPRVLGVLLGWRARGDGVVARGDQRVLDGWTAPRLSAPR